MTTFIYDVLIDLKNKGLNHSDLTFVIPSKRAGLFLKNELLKITDKTIFAPEIISIEEFVEQISNIKSISNTELLFEFYNIYIQLTKNEDIEPFESFSKWGQILIQDFNEIDRYLIPQDKIFNYLSAIQDLKHWSLEEPKTDFVKKYLAFWDKLYIYYLKFTESLVNKNKGYQGLIYRKATENLNAYIKENTNKKHIFLGFNALNTAEETIIQKLLENQSAEIYWDIDRVFIENPKHDAALFTRKHKKSWNYFEKNPFNWVTEHYSKEKNISVFGIPKNVGQAKYIGSILKDLQTKNKTLENTAVILGDENLLIPFLNSIPESINALNITMGFPLKAIPLATLFENLFIIHKNNPDTFYYKHVIKILSHQFIQPLFVINKVDYASKIIETIQNNNLIYLSSNRIKQIDKTCETLIELLFGNWEKSVDSILNNCADIITAIKNHLNENKTANLLSLEYLYRFNELFNEIKRLNTEFNHVKNITVLHEIYKELLNSESLDFQGEPLEGLQIMGMLESRVLDFETVIISSVNEGILPSGKSNNSFIPFDVKLENNLPTYKEKDAVYTYHFYRLLQRAKNIYILYNTEADTLNGGEKSRFITQLEIENIHTIEHQIIAPQVPSLASNPITIEKNEDLIVKLKEVALKGFSPSSLTNYIRNPIDFYYQKILNIKEFEEVEETVAANTLGTVVHNTLEDFYKPLENTFLSVDLIENLKSKIEETVKFHFKNEYKEGDITLGKNLIIFEIAKRYVSNFLDLEISELKSGNEIKIIAIETNNEISITVPELDYPVTLKGKVDRVDQHNGITRIIDYKTGKVDQNKVQIVNWEDITSDYEKYSKSFQILTYAYMMQHSGKIQLPIEAGIISFKNLGAGVLKFSKKDKSGRGAIKDTLITTETLDSFSVELQKLITEICSENIPFVEKEIESFK